ncbi:hypothetical protein [Mesorhizobium muleiense]|uniref:Uncharacterized protein n=1 Tax=Mesorhizobium muleiense TaxID=1004279 RepID=A0A1G9BVS9_9HYPH|nr:hypothetical protein [Mesorhizobium muleiense]MCF6103848.1 hypothetical protein [Mesorhizobium muleiense]SDK43490.1 hypothetical protein SAMN05428953_11582 [Mesorhizobium muleiense]
MSEDREAFNQRIEHARIAHESHRASTSSAYSVLSQFANTAMRAPAVASAGGIAVLLGFYSANSSVLKGSAAVADFNAALFWFFVSILLCVAAPGLAWFSQGFFFTSSSAYELAWEHPFVRATAKTKRFKTMGRVLQVVSVLLIVIAIVALIAGAWKFMAVADFIART